MKTWFSVVLAASALTLLLAATPALACGGGRYHHGAGSWGSYRDAGAKIRGGGHYRTAGAAVYHQPAYRGYPVRQTTGRLLHHGGRGWMHGFH